MEKQTNEYLKMILEEVRKANFDQLLQNNPINKDWIPRNAVMDYLGYADTQMTAIERKYSLTVSKLGKRKFYHRDSINSLLQDNIILPL